MNFQTRGGEPFAPAPSSTPTEISAGARYYRFSLH
jgi:hypothetical protein